MTCYSETSIAKTPVSVLEQHYREGSVQTLWGVTTVRKTVLFHYKEEDKLESRTHSFILQETTGQRFTNQSVGATLSLSDFTVYCSV